MRQCEHCQRPLQASEYAEYLVCRLCWIRRERLIEQTYWPEVRALFSQLAWIVVTADTRPIARHALDELLDVPAEYIDLSHRSALPHGKGDSLAVLITHRKRLWDIWQQKIHRYETLAAQGNLASEFHVLLLEYALPRRREERRRLRHFGVDIQRRDAFQRARKLPSQTCWGQYDKMDETVQRYNVANSMILTCLLTVHNARETGKNFYTTIAEAVCAMRVVLLHFIEELVMRRLDSPIPSDQTRAMINLAGYIRPQIKMHASVREVLRKEGEPRIVLLERLPAYILQAHSAGAKKPAELAEAVKRLVNQVRRRQRKEPLSHTSEPTLEALAGHRQSRQGNTPNELEEWYSKQEASQLLDMLIPRARLSLREAEVLALQRAGMSHASIARELGVKKGSVKQWTHRLKKKLEIAANL